MLSTAATLYLPLSTAILDAVLDPSQAFDQVVSKLPVPQIAALIVIQQLPTAVGKRSPSPERMLSDTIELGVRYAQQEKAPEFIGEVLRILHRDQIRAACELLPDAGILLLNDEDLQFRSYLLPDGTWNSTFCERHRAQIAKSLQRTELPSGESRTLTTEQSKIYHEIRGSMDDHLHVQGYAGTGKSFLIKSLLDLLQHQHARTLVLAEYPRQLDSLLKGTEGIERMYKRTFGQLVREMIPPDLTNPVTRRMRRTNYSPHPMPDDEIVRMLGIHPTRRHLATAVAKMAHETVNVFCSSDDADFGRQHIPLRYFDLDPEVRQVMLHHATELWKAILLPPDREFDPPVRNRHRVKWAALQGLKVPESYTHILIDECHDLARPMMQILDHSPQAIFSLGDQYQNLQGQASQRTGSLRHREVTHSVRAGRGIEDIVNPLIRAHPADNGAPFHGHLLSRTEVTYYDKPKVPDQPAVILVSDLWGLLEWAQRLAEGTDFQLLSDPGDLNTFVTDLIELYRNDVRPRHRELFRFASSQALAEHYQHRRDVGRIDAMLRRGYSLKDWARTSAKFNPESTSGYALGLISDVRNHEFPAVMLAPDVIERTWSGPGAAAPLSAAYVGVTRGRQRLILPEQLPEWIYGLSSSKAKTLDG